MVIFHPALDSKFPLAVGKHLYNIEMLANCHKNIVHALTLLVWKILIVCRTNRPGLIAGLMYLYIHNNYCTAQLIK